jgi:hypothetical protein
MVKLAQAVCTSNLSETGFPRQPGDIQGRPETLEHIQLWRAFRVDEN